MRPHAHNAKLAVAQRVGAGVEHEKLEERNRSWLAMTI